MSYIGICSLCQGEVFKHMSGISCAECGATVKAKVIEMDPSTQFPEFTTGVQLLNENRGK